MKKLGHKMDEVKTIDPRGLEHSEREALIFPSIEGIRKDETLNDKEWEDIKKECDKIGYY